MPIKKDGTGQRWVEMDFVAPGTPEEVWEAMATGPGNTAWFTKTTIEGRVGGALAFDFDAHGTSKGEVTAWEPPRRFAYVEREWSEGAPPVATEITITARAGDQCTVRMVHSLFASTDDWDDQLEGFEKGWPAFFEVLRLYLAHFKGQRAASFIALARADGDQLPLWQRLVNHLGLAGADAGESRTTPSSPDALSASVERVEQSRQQRYILLRVEAPAPGLVLFGTYQAGASVNVSATMYFYGEDADARARASKPRWSEWLNARFVPAADQAVSG